MRSSLKIELLAVAAAVMAAAAAGPAWAQGAAPVTAAPVTRQNVPVYDTGVGTVTPDQTVQIKARVDGTIDKIAFTEGQTVKAGDFLIEIDPRPYQAALSEAEAKRQQDLANLTDALLNQKRDAALVKSYDVPQQTLDTQNAAVAADRAAVAGDTAAVAAAQLNLDYTHITSPIDGRVGLRQVDLGNLVQAASGTTLVTVTMIHPIAVDFTLPQDQMSVVSALLASGKPAQVQALSGNGGTKLATGQLLTADNQIDTSTGTIKLKAMFPNRENHLWPGEFVNVKLLTSILPNVLTVPSAAVQHSPDGPFVYVIGADRKVTSRAVGLGPDDGTTAVITSGLQAGELVVSAGASRLADGSPVAIQNGTAE